LKQIGKEKRKNVRRTKQEELYIETTQNITETVNHQPTFVTILSSPPFKAITAMSSAYVVTPASISAGIFQTFIDIYGSDT